MKNDFKFSNSEIEFFETYNFDPDFILDARTMDSNERKRIMKNDRIDLYIASSSCLRGHQIRTRAGRCPQCHPASIGFMRRWDTPANLYFAHSIESKQIKIGYTENIDDRAFTLNKTRYGDASDWQIIMWFHHKDAAKLEDAILKSLKIGCGDLFGEFSINELKRSEVLSFKAAPAAIIMMNRLGLNISNGNIIDSTFAETNEFMRSTYGKQYYKIIDKWLDYCDAGYVIWPVAET